MNPRKDTHWVVKGAIILLIGGIALESFARAARTGDPKELLGLFFFTFFAIFFRLMARSAAKGSTKQEPDQSL